MTLKDLLIKHEGIRLKPYLDCCGKAWRECTCSHKGKLTIGVGRNLDDVGLTMDEAMLLCDNDIEKAMRQAGAAFPWFKSLPGCRPWVIVSMIFNLGISKFLDFRGMIAAIQKQDWNRAADEMMNSKWAFQVGDGPGGRKDRAEELAQMMKEGKA